MVTRSTRRRVCDLVIASGFVRWFEFAFLEPGAGADQSDQVVGRCLRPTDR